MLSPISGLIILTFSQHVCKTGCYNRIIIRDEKLSRAEIQRPV